MIYIEPGVYVRVLEFAGSGPLPRPLANGFSEVTAYRVLGVYSPAETSEGYFILANDRDELWYISQRHFRVVAALGVQERALHLPLEGLNQAESPRRPDTLPARPVAETAAATPPRPCFQRSGGR